jgi:hypothetical protein
VASGIVWGRSGFVESQTSACTGISYANLREQQQNGRAEGRILASLSARPMDHGRLLGRLDLGRFDQQLYSYVVPTVISVWDILTGVTGTIGTVSVVTSAFGG